MDIPNLQDEINRKTGQTLSDLLANRQGEMISDDQLILSVKAIWGAVAGLVDQSLIDLMSTMMDGNELFGNEYVQVYGGKGKLIAAKLTRHINATSTLEVKSLIGNQSVKTFIFDQWQGEKSPAQQAIEKLTLIGDQLVQGGVKRLL
jgi:hypothetical protein